MAAVPYFWVAILLAFGFAFYLGWLPLSGGWDSSIPIGFSWAFISSAIMHAILPAFSIILTSIGGWMVPMRNMMVTTLNEDYVLLGHAKGLTDRRVMYSYAARNAILPSISSFAISIGTVLSGSLLTEKVFNYPGVGNMLFKAVQSLDYPLMQGLFLVTSLAVLVANFTVDSINTLLDPRTREAD